MTSAQEASNGHCVSPPPPCSPENPPNKANINRQQRANNEQVVERQKGVAITPLLAHEKVASVSPGAQPTAPGATDASVPERQAGPFAASAYHFPPKHFSPRAHAYRHDDYLSYGKHPNPLPERCQFMFSDGRQCTMARSDIHPSLCVYHSNREEQLFGDPTYDHDNRALDFPELYSASRDLTTARGINRALAQVFRLLAQRRISRQEAATFAKLGQLLLQSISAMRAEAADDFVLAASSAILPNRVMPPCETNLHPALHREAPPAARPEIPPAPPSDSGLAVRRTERTPATSESAARSEAPPRPASLPGTVPFAARAQAEDSSSTADHAQNQHLHKVACNPSEINSCKFPALETIQNQHLQKNAVGDEADAHCF